jgi:predicted ATP-grasp superfamily ATP-dependent carboligase
MRNPSHNSLMPASAARMPAIVLDGETRSALAATRSLGQRGVSVIVGATARRGLATASRHCNESFVYPSPREDERAFLEAVIDATRKYGAGIVLPVTDVTMPIVLAGRERLAPALVPAPPLASYQRASDKKALLHLAQELGVAAPRSVFLEPPWSVDEVVERVPFPLVLKPTRSQLRIGSQTIATAVRIVHSALELRELCVTDHWLPACSVIAQELIQGHGAGLFASYDSGAPVAFFAHRRLREKPPWGGVSVLSESAPLDRDMQAMAQRLLDALEWHGVAMVEFKVGADGQAKLMEINGRLWGSLQLSIDAGLDFPWLLYGLCDRSVPRPDATYRVGVRSRWLLGDVDNLAIQLRNARCCPSLSSRLQALGSFVAAFGTRQDVYRWSDPQPAFVEFHSWLASTFGRR